MDDGPSLMDDEAPANGNDARCTSTLADDGKVMDGWIW